jgi:putative membrane-bound dehydrogenase-like protein
MSRPFFAFALLALAPAAAFAQREYGFDNRKPSGQPYLSPDESVRRMKVADGFEVKLFAAEPMVVNPVAMTIDERGRVWVIECFEYPKRTPPGKMPRDRIVILEDTDGDGLADKRTVFAEGKDFPVRFDLATGIEVGHGGVFVGAAPYLWFIENKNDKPGKFEILLKGFGSQDTHETLNTLQWGPDGWLFGLHGIYTQSKVTTDQPEEQTREPIELNAGMWRYHPVTRKFEIVAEGTSNPWGWDYRNTDGQMILCCCVIPHLFHIVPGGVYKRQSGQSLNPYAYGYLNEICDHTFHKESGWAHAGLLSLDTPLMPPEYRDSVIFGSIHGCSIKRNVLKRNGSTFTASRADDFLVSGDKNFRPINLRWGPNGDIYVIDWHDQNPCHQAAADSWDYEHGRVYRIQKKGAATTKADDLSMVSDDEVVKLLSNENPYVYRTALRLRAERFPRRLSLDANVAISAAYRRFDLRANWAWAEITHYLTSMSTDSPLFPPESGERTPSPEFMVWAVRDAGQHEPVPTITRFIELAKREKNAAVRLELASTAQRLAKAHDTLPLLHALLQHKEDASDTVIPFMLWLAYESRLTARPHAELEWLRTNAPGNSLITEHILPRAMRRLVATGRAIDLADCVGFVAATKNAVRLKALEGLAEGLKARTVDAPPAWAALQSELITDANPQVQRLARALAVAFRDPAAVQRALAIVRDSKKPSEERAEAIRQLAQLKAAEAPTLFLSLARQENDLGVRQEAARGLAALDKPDLAKDILAAWKSYPPPVRGELVNVLAGNRAWAKDLLAAVAAGTVEKTALTANTVLRMRAFNDRSLNAEIEKVWGRVRNTPAELTKLIDTMRGELAAAPASFVKGKAVFEKQCSKCHQFEGRGHNIGPALDGAGRDIEYLLVNVLDPNRVVGQPYFVRRVVLKNGRIEEGLLAAEDGQTITLRGENDAQKVISKSDVEDVQVSEKSMMPEGLANAMTVQDFRDLVRYVMAHPFVSDWQLAGPFPQAKPELGKPSDPTTGGGVTWQARQVGVPGRLELPAAGAGGYVYATTTVTNSAPLRTRLLLGSGDSLVVWIDGREVLRGCPTKDPARPDQTDVPVELAAGTHRVTIEIHYRGDRSALYARFFDPDRKLVWK